MPSLVAGVGIGVGLLMPGPSDFMTGALESLVSEYATRQEWDVDWASGWRMSDDSHSRTNDGWVAIAMGWGIYNSFEIGVGKYTTNPIDWFASDYGTGSSGDGPLHHIVTD